MGNFRFFTQYMSDRVKWRKIVGSLVGLVISSISPNVSRCIVKEILWVPKKMSHWYSNSILILITNLILIFTIVLHFKRIVGRKIEIYYESGLFVGRCGNNCVFNSIEILVLMALLQVNYILFSGPDQKWINWNNPNAILFFITRASKTALFGTENSF